MADKKKCTTTLLTRWAKEDRKQRRSRVTWIEKTVLVLAMQKFLELLPAVAVGQRFKWQRASGAPAPRKKPFIMRMRFLGLFVMRYPNKKRSSRNGICEATESGYMNI